MTLFFFNYVYMFWLMLKSINIKKKFFYFFIFLINSSVWGFIYSVEGFIFLFLLTELLILLIFIFIYLTIQNNLYKNIKMSFLMFFIFSILCFFFKNTEYLLAEFQTHDVYSDIFKLGSEDYFVYFFFFFYNFTSIIYLLALLLTLFSIYFILFYLGIKILSLDIKKKKKITYFLRKQNMIHQTRYKPSYRTFQIIVSKRII